MLDSFYLQYLFGGFVSLIVITNPLSKIPLFISLTQGMSLDVRKRLTGPAITLQPSCW